MTELEALETIHGEQGYLVLNSNRDYREGQIVGENGHLFRDKIKQPMRVTGLASRDEFMRQVRRIDELLGTNTEGREMRHPKLYKVVAPD